MQTRGIPTQSLGGENEQVYIREDPPPTPVLAIRDIGKITENIAFRNPDGAQIEQSFTGTAKHESDPPPEICECANTYIYEIAIGKWKTSVRILQRLRTKTEIEERETIAYHDRVKIKYKNSNLFLQKEEKS